MKTLAQMIQEEEELSLKLRRLRGQIDWELERELKELYELLIQKGASRK